MRQTCWQVTHERGFLIYPDPIESVSGFETGLAAEAAEHLEFLAKSLPELMENRAIRNEADQMPVYDVPVLNDVDDFRVIERVWQIYGFLASAYIWAMGEKPARHLPASIAIPLVALSRLVERPPIVSYADYTLSNWKRIDDTGEIAVDNLDLIQYMIRLPDAKWFTAIHIDIEARAAQAIGGVLDGLDAAGRKDVNALENALLMIQQGLARMIQSFRRMPEGCDTDVYYHKIRPYMFGFEGVIYEGVDAFRGEPQSFRGETGAQSSVIPALVAALGIRHEHNSLIEHLEIMKAYMPCPHRKFLESIDRGRIRSFALSTPRGSSLREMYNECLRQLLAFRQLHYHFAAEYIASKAENPQGTGGTIFMPWLKQLIEETETQFI